MPSEPNPTQVSLIDSERNVHGFAFAHGAIYPYANLYPEQAGEIVGEVDFKFDEIKWNNAKSKGTIQLEVDGEIFEFEVTQYDGKLKFRGDYREWYGYPAQALLVVTMPLDIVVSSIGGIILLVSAPFIGDKVDVEED
ncbi:MAG: hypothetical protein HWE27_14005 [Gammaproteobacteria bacterium]|nr:hypothetical protein [Gammaproteobacteria bacterium]